MMVQLYEGCFGVTRGGDGVSQEVVGPITRDSPEPAFGCSGFVGGTWCGVWKESGASDFFGLPPDPIDQTVFDIIAVFPDRASAEAALAGGEPLPGGEGKTLAELGVKPGDVVALRGAEIQTGFPVTLHEILTDKRPHFYLIRTAEEDARIKYPEPHPAEPDLAGGEPLPGAPGGEAAKLLSAIRWAHDTLWELNPNNYDHDEVCKVNDAAVEVILGLAPLIGETHGKSPEWWAARINRFEPEPTEVGAGAALRPAEPAPADVAAQAVDIANAVMWRLEPIAWRIQYLSASRVPCGEIYFCATEDRVEQHRQKSDGMLEVIPVYAEPEIRDAIITAAQEDKP